MNNTINVDGISVSYYSKDDNKGYLRIVSRDGEKFVTENIPEYLMGIVESNFCKTLCLQDHINFYETLLNLLNLFNSERNTIEYSELCSNVKDLFNLYKESKN